MDVVEGFLAGLEALRSHESAVNWGCVLCLLTKIKNLPSAFKQTTVPCCIRSWETDLLETNPDANLLNQFDLFTRSTFQYEEDDEIKELKSLLTQRLEETSDTEPSNPGDDDLVPYDMSQDQELKKTRAPTYIRDCFEILTGPEDAEKYEAAVGVLETLIRRDTATAQEMSVELAKVLLHLEEKSYIEGFVGLRQGALVAVTVADPIRVLAVSAQELSRPASCPSKPHPSRPSIQIISHDASSPDWKKVVDERIRSKTRRFAKGLSQAEQLGAPNQFTPVAGHFFFPLLRNFDRYVRHGLLSSVSSILLGVPAEYLLEDMTEELLETQAWLADVTEKDPDGDCRHLALQNLLLMENLKKKLETDPLVYRTS
ncbi:hypothetical protein Chor_015173 [Crotalus horridus]